MNDSDTSSAVVGRWLFYNRATSTLFGDGSGNPTNAIDPSKVALLPNESSSYANYSNYTRGLNGILVDINGPVDAVTAADFQFSRSDGLTPNSFVPIDPSASVTIIPGGGSGGSNRIKLEFPDNRIRNTWLQVIVLANARTGLAAPDVFYFGNMIADMNVGNRGSPKMIDTSFEDLTVVKQNQSVALNSASISNVADINKDGRVNGTDISLVQQYQRSSEYIRAITAPALYRAPIGRNNTVPINEDQTYFFHDSDFGFSDPNDIPPNSFQAVKITTLPERQQGRLMLNGLPISAGRIISFVEIPTLSFEPTPNLYGDSLGFFTFQVIDSGPQSSNGSENIDRQPRILSFNIAPMPDGPSISSLSNISLNEDSSGTTSTIAILDPDTSWDDLAISITSSNESLIDFSGLVLERYGEEFRLHAKPKSNRSGSSVIQLSVSDGMSTASQSLTLTVTPVSDAPTSRDGFRTIQEEQVVGLQIVDFPIQDSDDVPSNDLSGIEIKSVTHPIYGQLKLSGTPVSVGTFIPRNAIADLTFTPAADFSHARWNAFTFLARDDGSISNGGRNVDPIERTFYFEIRGINDPPTISPIANILMREDTVAAPIVFSVIDSDTPVSQLTVAIVSSNPELIDSDSISVTGSGSSRQVILEPKANRFGTSTLTVSVGDGVSTRISSFTATVLPVNDPPSGRSSLKALVEDGRFTFRPEDFQFSDSIDTPSNAFDGIFIESIPDPMIGQLLRNQTPVQSESFIRYADLGMLSFVPEPNRNGRGVLGFTFRVQDDGDVANGGFHRDTTLRTISFDIRSVNDAPTALDRMNQEVLSGQRYHFSPRDFRFDDLLDDPPNALQEVIIASIPNASDGKLELAGRSVTANQSIPASHLNNLVFTPEPGVTGSDRGVFQFQIRDNGGTIDSGNNLGGNTATFSFRVLDAVSGPVERIEIAADSSVRTIYEDDADSYFAGRNYSTDEGVPPTWFANQGDEPTLRSVLSHLASLVYLKFNLTDIQPGYESIELKLHAIRSRSLDGTSSDLDQIAALVSDRWQEDTIVEESAPGFGRTVAHWTVSSTLASPQTISMDLTSAVKNAQEVGETSISFVIHASIEGPGDRPQGEVVYASRESEAFANRPHLVVHYPEASAPITAPSSIELYEDTAYAFSFADFPYPASNSEEASGVKVRSLPNAGRLGIRAPIDSMNPTVERAFVPVLLGETIPKSIIDAGRFEFLPAGELSGRRSSTFEFSVVDASHIASAPATMTIDVLANDALTVLHLGSLYHRNGMLLLGAHFQDDTGRRISNAGDVNRDGYDDLLISAPEALAPGGVATGDPETDTTRRFGGKVYLVYGGPALPEHIDLLSLGTSGVVMVGARPRDTIGRGLSGGGDLNGDGYPDILIGGQAGSSSGVGPGNGYVIFGGPALPETIDLDVLGERGIAFYGRDKPDQSGFSVSFAGDLNGDGFDDLAIGAYGSEGFANEKEGAGETYILFGRAVFPSKINLGEHGAVDVTIYGEDWGDHSGYSLSRAGDVNDDGFDDLLVGARLASPETLGARDPNSHVILVVPFDGGSAIPDGATFSITHIVNEQPKTLVFEFDANASGPSVATNFPISDYDGKSPDEVADRIGVAIRNAFYDQGLNYFPKVRQNGRLDLGVNAAQIDISLAPALVVEHHFVPNYGTERPDGASYLIYGRPELPKVMKLEELGDAGVKIYGNVVDGQGVSTNQAPTIQFGESVSGAGDVNGDGYDDILIGAPKHGDFSGAAVLIFGSKHLPQQIDRQRLLQLETRGMFLYGDAFADNTGISVSTAGDLNGDGYSDIVVGASNAHLYDSTSLGQPSPFFPDIVPEHVSDIFFNGRSYVIFGNPNLPASYSLRDLFVQGTGGTTVARQSNPEVLMLTGSTQSDGAGHAVSTAGDLNGDGYDDLLVAAPRAMPHGLNSGQIHVLYGNAFSRLHTVEGTAHDDIDLIESVQSNIVIGGRGNDRLTGTSPIAVVMGGEGDDSIIISNTSFRQIKGGAGNDRLVLEGTGQTLDLTTLSNSRVQGIEEIDIQGNRLRLNFRDVIRISDESNTLIIHGTTGDTAIGSGWIQQSDEIRASNVFHVFTQGVAILKIQRSVSPIYNSPPVGSDRTRSQSIYPSVYSFSISDFLFHDDFDLPENNFDGIEIMSTPESNEGILLLDFLPVSVGNQIHVSQIPKLQFVPNPTAVGRGLGRFSFKVLDDGGLGVPIGIVNPSFELPELPNDGDSNNTTIPGWQIDGIAGVFNPVSTIYKGANTTDRQQLAFAADGSLTQELSASLASDTRYQLQVDVGARLDKPSTSYRIALYAGEHLLADASQADFATLNGGFITATLHYVASPSNPYLGLPLRIVLSSLGDQINFDRVRLSRAPLESDPSDTDRESKIFSFDIGVNRPPRGRDITLNALEDQEYFFQSMDFGFTDSEDNPVDTFHSVYIETLPNPSEGVLWLGDETISGPRWISAAILSSLKFVPASNVFGERLGTFTFRVRDDGGEINGGRDTDLVARTIAFDIAGVNDQPTIGFINNITISEDTTSPPVLVSLSDLELPIDQLTLQIATDNPTLLRSDDVVLARGDGNSRLTVSPQRNQSGNAVVTISVTDGLSAPVSTSFTVHVSPVNDPPKTVTFERVAYRGVPLRLRWEDFRFSDVEGAVSPSVFFIGSYHDQPTPPDASDDFGDTNSLQGLRLGSQTLSVNQMVSRDSIERILNPAVDGLFFDPPLNGPGSSNPSYARFTFRVSDGDRDSTTAMLLLRIENMPPTSQSLAIANVVLLRPFIDYENLDEFNEPMVDPTRSINPTITGSVKGVLPSGQTATIEFFHDDAILIDSETEPDGSVTVSSTDVPFLYDPRDSSPSLIEFAGPMTLHYRVHYAGAALPLPIHSFSFHKLPVPVPKTYRVRNALSNFPLAYSAIPGSSTPSEGFLQGKVDREIRPEESGLDHPYFGDLAGSVKVEIALDSLPNIHHSFLTDSTGEFRTKIPSLPVNLNSLFIRVQEWNGDFGGYLPSSFQLISFVPLPTTAPVILSLAPERFLDESANPPTTDQARIVGQVSLATGIPRAIYVRWSDDNGATWNRSNVDERGKFFISSTPLTSSTTTIRARAVAIDSRLGMEIESEDASLSFRYVPPAWPSFSEFKLVNDTHVPLDGITTDTTVSGMLAGGVPDQNFRIEFDIDNDSMADASVEADSSGRFTYLPALPLNQDSVVRARLKRWNRELKAYEASDWPASPPSNAMVFVRRIPPDSSSLSITELVLTGGKLETTTVPKTSRPAIQGRVAGSPYTSIRWDQNADSIWDGETKADSSGLFEFEPVGLGNSQHTIVVQAFALDAITGTTITGNTNSISFELVATLNQAPVITDLKLLSDSGIDGDGRTRNPGLIGRVTNDGPIENLAVGIDMNSDLIVDATTFTSSDGTFVYTPNLSTFGEKTIKARVFEYDPDSRNEIPSSWRSMTFVFEDQMDRAPVIRDLVYDDFSRDPNTQSQLPTLRGRITNELRVSSQLIELDINGDSTVDVSVLTDDRGAFSLAIPDLPEGVSILRIRAHETNEANRQSQTSLWVEKPIIHQMQSMNAPTLVEFELVLDDGTSAADNRTSDPRLRGRIDDREFTTSILVQVDLDGDYVADDAANVQSDGEWTVVPKGLAAGDRTVHARTRSEMSTQNVIYGEWVPFTFHLLPSANTASIDTFVLSNDNGTSNSDRSTSDATLTGTLGNVRSGQSTVVVFDHNGDGIEDGQLTTTNGTFTYTPSNLNARGWVTLQAQTRSNGGDTNGQWASISFVLHEAPDSLAAQWQLQNLLEFERTKQATIQAGQAARQARVDAARNSDIVRKSEVDAANAERISAIDEAERVAQQEGQQANRVRQLEIDAANAAFMNAMQNFRGNPQSFVFDPMTLAAIPATGILQLPNDAQFAIPPRNLPNNEATLPSIDSDIEFQTIKKRIEDAFQLFVSSRADLRRTQDSETLDRYLQWMDDSEVLRKQDIRRAQDELDQAIQASPSDQLRRRLMQASNDYQAANIAAEAAIANAAKELLEYEIATFGNDEGGIGSFFEDHYRNVILPLFEDWIEPSAQAIAANTEPALDNGLFLANTIAHLAATKSLDTRQARFVHHHMAAWWGRFNTHQEVNETARLAMELAQVRLRESRRNAHADSNQELQPMVIAARKKFELAKVKAEFEHQTRIANATRTRDTEFAKHAKEEMLAIESRRSKSWRDIALARKNAATARAVAQNTPWNRYQKQLATNEYEYIMAIAPDLSSVPATDASPKLHGEYWRRFAEGNEARELAIIQARYDRDSQIAQIKFDQFTGSSMPAPGSLGAIDFLEEYWTTLSNEGHDLERDQIAINGSLDRDEALAYYRHAKGTRVANVERSLRGSDLVLQTELEGLANLEVFGLQAHITQNASSLNRKYFGLSSELVRDYATRPTWTVAWQFDEDVRLAWFNYEQSTSLREAEYATKIADAFRDYRVRSALLDWESSKNVAAAIRDFEKAVAGHKWMFVENTEAPNNQVLEDHQSLHAGIRELADTTALHQYRRESASEHRTMIEQWATSFAIVAPGLRSEFDRIWSAYQVTLADTEYNWIVEAGDAAITAVLDVQTAEVNQAYAASLAEKNRRLAYERAEKVHSETLADAQYDFVASTAGYLSVNQQAIDTHTNSLRTIARQRNARDTQYARNATRYGTFLENHRDYRIAADNASNDRDLAVQLNAENVTEQSTLGPINKIVYLDIKNYFPDWASNGVTVAQVDELRTAERLANAAANERYHASNNALAMSSAAIKAEAQNLWRRSQSFEPAKTQSDRVNDELAYLEEATSTKRTYIDGHANRSVLLAEALRHARVVRERERLLADLDRTHAGLIAQKDFDVAITTANNKQTRAEYLADANRRQRQVAARGTFEVSLYESDRDRKQAVEQAAPSSLASLQHRAAIAQADYAEAIRISRNRYESEVTRVELARIDQRNSASMMRVQSRQMTDLSLSTQSRPFEEAYGVEVIEANARFAKARSVAEIEAEKNQANIELDFLHQRKLAEKQHVEANRMLANEYSVTLADAHSQAEHGSRPVDTTVLSSARKSYNDQLKTARRGYAQQIGTVLVERAEKLGDAKITLATALGAADTELANGNRSALQTYQVAIAPLRKSHDLAVANHESTFAKKVAEIDAGLGAIHGIGWELESATVQQRIDEGLASSTFAGALAHAEISFLIEEALGERNRASDEAVANPNVPQAKYNASYAAAKHQWLIGQRDQYVFRMSSHATVDAALATDLAIAKRKLVESRLRIQRDFLGDQVLKAYQLHSDQIDAMAQRDAGLNQLVLQRWIDKETFTQQFSIEIAMAEKELIKDRAIIEADFQKEVLERLLLSPTLEEIDGSYAESQFLLPIEEMIDDGFVFERTRRSIRRESARLKYDDAKDDAEAKWKKADNESRLKYTIGNANQSGDDNPLRLGESGVEKRYLEATSNRKKTYDIEIGMLENGRDRELTTAQIAAWSEETIAENHHRTSQATADLDFWSVQENQRLIAHTSIRTDLGTPWSSYLVRAAQARIAAFQIARSDYWGMVTDRNQSENRRRAALSSAFRIREDAMADARQAYSIATAESVNISASATAAAQHDYLQLASTAAKAFADELADDKDASPDEYYAEEAMAWVNREKAMAQVTFDASQAKTNADRDHELSKIRSQIEYRKAESKAYSESVGRLAKIDRVFAIQHAYAFTVASVQMAQAYPTPWSYHDATAFSTEYSRTRKVAISSEKRSRSLATAQSRAERELADTDLAKHEKIIAASQHQSNEQARIHRHQTNGNVDIVQALADLGNYKTKHPTVADAPDIGSMFAIDSVESFGFYLPINPPRNQTEPNSGWDFRPKTWFNSNEDIWTIPASSFDSQTGNYDGHSRDGMRTFIQNPLYSHQAYAWWGYSNTRHWIEFTPSSTGELVQTANQFHFIEPSKTVDDNFWNLDDEYDRIASPLHVTTIHTLSPTEPIARPADDSLIVNGQKPELPFSVAGFVELIEGIAKLVTIDEIVRQMQTLNERFAEFLYKSGTITETAAARRPANALGEQAIPASSTGHPNLVAEPNRSENPLQHDSQFIITFAANVNSPEYEAIRLESELKNPQTRQSESIAKSFQQHIDERTPGFRQRHRIPRKDFYYENAEAVFSRDYIDIKGEDVYWVTRRYERNLILRYLNDYILYETKIGVRGQGGWVRLASGEHATIRALRNMASRYYGATNEQINQALDAAISPYAISPQSSQYGIFIGGTGMHFFGIGNVERLYNLYQGSKFYYGGVGNAIDFLSYDYLANGSGLGGTAIIERILADIKQHHQPGQKIHIFGWSRGATEANTLATRLQALGMRVDFLGMYDPVDSVGLPGGDALESESTWGGYFGNYVTATIPGNVAVATTIYAINEDRSFFPATYFNTPGATEHITLKSVGAHGEIGGHFQSNMPMQQLAYSAMLEYASSPGGVQVRLAESLEHNVQRIMMSPVTRELALGGFDKKDIEAAKDLWLFAGSEKQWIPYSIAKFIDALTNRSSENWWPGPYGDGLGLQAGNLEAILAGVVGNAAKLRLARGVSTILEPPTPFYGHYFRDLDWVDKEIWDLPLRNGERRISLNQETKDFIRSLYRKKVNGSKGGWIGETVVINSSPPR